MLRSLLFSPARKSFPALFLLFLFVAGGPCSAQQPEAGHQTDSIVVDQSMKMRINYPYVHNQQLEDGLKKANDKLLYLAVITAEGRQTPVCVSKYFYSEKLTIQEAFDSNVKFRPANSESSYKLLEHGEVEKEGKTLRYKISEITFEPGKKTNSIIYYFMKNDEANVLYELKLVCSPEGLARFKGVTEKIALSVELE